MLVGLRIEQLLNLSAIFRGSGKTELISGFQAFFFLQELLKTQRSFTRKWKQEERCASLLLLMLINRLYPRKHHCFDLGRAGQSWNVSERFYVESLENVKIEILFLKKIYLSFIIILNSWSTELKKLRF